MKRHKLMCLKKQFIHLCGYKEFHINGKRKILKTHYCFDYKNKTIFLLNTKNIRNMFYKLTYKKRLMSIIKLYKHNQKKKK